MILSVIGVAIIVAGGLLGIYGLVQTSYNPLGASWGFDLYAFWAGVAALIVGVVTVFFARYYLTEPHERRRAEITV